MPDNTSRVSTSSARWVILIGICSTMVGVLSDLQLERHSFAMTTIDFEFFFLERVFLPALILGLIVTLVGSILWGLHAPIRNVALWGLGIVVLVPLSLALIPINIHGWTMSLMLAGVGMTSIGGLLLIFAAVREFKKHRRGAIPRVGN